MFFAAFYVLYACEWRAKRGIAQEKDTPRLYNAFDVIKRVKGSFL